MFGDSGDELLAPADPDPIQCPAIAQTGEADWRFTATHPLRRLVVRQRRSDDRSVPGQAAGGGGDRRAGLGAGGAEHGRPARRRRYPRTPATRSGIDIYLVPLNKCIRRDAGPVCAALTSRTTIARRRCPMSPCDGSRGPLTSSGYALMRLDLVPDAAPAAGAVAKARSDFAHEFFHLLTYGLNLEAQGGACRDRQFTGAIVGRTSWLTEASGDLGRVGVHAPTTIPNIARSRFSDYQQRVPSSTRCSTTASARDDNPAYQAFVYPLFLSQEAGRAACRSRTSGRAARAPRTPEALDDALDARWAFDRYFRDFAVKMLNMTLPGDPLAPLLSAFDAAVPPDFPPLNMLPEVMLPELVTDFPFHVTLAPLAAQHQLLHGAAHDALGGHRPVGRGRRI